MIAFGADKSAQGSGVSVNPDQPARRRVRAARNRREPQRVAGQCQAEGLAVLRPLAEELAAAIETLNAAVLAIGHVDDVAFVDLDRMRQAELARTGAGLAPLV